MEKVTVEVEVRNETGKQALHELRRSGKVPAVLYGGTGQVVNLQLHPRQLAHVLGTKSKHHTLFQLQVQGGEETLAMVAETQWVPVKGTLRHVDFKRVLMNRKIRVHVPIVTVGESRGIKEQGGVYELLIRELEVECLPGDLLEEFTFDVTPMMLHEQVRVSDLQGKIGDRIHILREPQAVICQVVAPKAVEEVKPEEVVVVEGAAEPEVIKKGKAVDEGEEPAEAPAKKEK
ncbi:MAG: 50S ribosomal protein L25 [Acidobacteria bacterium]|nr:50S ribosomal protein L25 [Acidobacteriota bacterium]